MASNAIAVEVHVATVPPPSVDCVAESEWAARQGQLMVWHGRLSGALGIAGEQVLAAGLTQREALARFGFVLDALGVPEGDGDARV